MEQPSTPVTHDLENTAAHAEARSPPHPPAVRGISAFWNARVFLTKRAGSLFAAPGAITSLACDQSRISTR